MDNYELAVETAEKCCQANTQFAEISEVRTREEQEDYNNMQVYKYIFLLRVNRFTVNVCGGVGGGEIGQKANRKGGQLLCKSWRRCWKCDLSVMGSFYHAYQQIIQLSITSFFLFFHVRSNAVSNLDKSK